jgi:hypothetical protein
MKLQYYHDENEDEPLVPSNIFSLADISHHSRDSVNNRDNSGSSMNSLLYGAKNYDGISLNNNTNKSNKNNVNNIKYSDLNISRYPKAPSTSTPTKNPKNPFPTPINTPVNSIQNNPPNLFSPNDLNLTDPNNLPDTSKPINNPPPNPILNIPPFTPSYTLRRAQRIATNLSEKSENISTPFTEFSSKSAFLKTPVVSSPFGKKRPT